MASKPSSTRIIPMTSFNFNSSTTVIMCAVHLTYLCLSPFDMIVPTEEKCFQGQCPAVETLVPKCPFLMAMALIALSLDTVLKKSVIFRAHHYIRIIFFFMKITTSQVQNIAPLNLKTSFGN